MLFKLLWLKLRLDFLGKVMEVSGKLLNWAYKKRNNIMKEALNNVINKLPECEEKERAEKLFEDLGL